MILVGVRVGNAFDAINMEIDPKNQMKQIKIFLNLVNPIVHQGDPRFQDRVHFWEIGESHH